MQDPRSPAVHDPQPSALHDPVIIPTVHDPVIKAAAPRRRKRWVWIFVVCLLSVVLTAAGLWFSHRPTGMRHYLLLGRDQWGVTNDVGRTDVMMLVSLDYDRQGVLLTSFLRDTQITLPKGGKDRLNTLAQYYGDQALADYLTDTYGIDIAGTFSVNFTSMMHILDAVGGITVDLTAAEVRYLRKQAGDYGAEFTLREGPCKINGAQAVAYMRCRSLDNDMGRTMRQANVLQALMQQVRGMQSAQVIQLVPQLAGRYTTNVALTEQLALARDAFTLRNAELCRHQIPADGTFRYASLRGGSVLSMNEEKNKALFAAFLRGE